MFCVFFITKILFFLAINVFLRSRDVRSLHCLVYSFHENSFETHFANNHSNKSLFLEFYRKKNETKTHFFYEKLKSDGNTIVKSKLELVKCKKIDKEYSTSSQITKKTKKKCSKMKHKQSINSQINAKFGKNDLNKSTF